MSQATHLIPHHSFSHVSSAYILSPHWETVGELPSLPLLPSSIYAGSLSGSPQRLTLGDLIQSQSFTPGSSYEKPGGRSKQRAKRNTPKPTEWALLLSDTRQSMKSFYPYFWEALPIPHKEMLGLPPLCSSRGCAKAPCDVRCGRAECFTQGPSSLPCGNVSMRVAGHRVGESHSHFCSI
ncbi:uncharacterized protein LOC144329916 [Macaca mulatta]